MVGGIVMQVSEGRHYYAATQGGRSWAGDIIMQVNERRRDYNAKRALKGGIVLKEFLARTVGRYDVPFYSSWSVLQCGYTDCCYGCHNESRLYVTAPV